MMLIGRKLKRKELQDNKINVQFASLLFGQDKFVCWVVLTSSMHHVSKDSNVTLCQEIKINVPVVVQYIKNV